MCPVGGMAKFSDALGVQFDYESGSIGCLRSATAVCLYREGHQHREIMVPRSSGGIDWIGSSRSIQVIDLFWNYWREFSVCYGWTESKAWGNTGSMSSQVLLVEVKGDVGNGRWYRGRLMWLDHMSQSDHGRPGSVEFGMPSL